MGIEGVKKLVDGAEFHKLDWRDFFVKAFEAYTEPELIKVRTNAPETKKGYPWIKDYPSYEKGHKDGRGIKAAEESEEVVEGISWAQVDVPSYEKGYKQGRKQGRKDGGHAQPPTGSGELKWIYDKGFENGHTKGVKATEESGEFKTMVVKERKRAEKEGYEAGLATATKEIEKKAEAEIYKRGFDDAASRYNIKYKDGFNKGKKLGEKRGRILGLGEAEKAMAAHIKKLEKKVEKKEEKEEKDG